MTEEQKVFKLSDYELSNPKNRKGSPGYMYMCYPSTPTWQRNNAESHANYKPLLSAYYRSKGYVGIRGDLMTALNNTIKPLKKKNYSGGE